jgi:hypothetical protein
MTATAVLAAAATFSLYRRHRRSMSNCTFHSRSGSGTRQCPLRSRSLDFARFSRRELFALWSGTLLAFVMIVGVADAEAKTLDGDYSLLCGEVQQHGDRLVGGDRNLSCAMLRTAQNYARSIRDEDTKFLPETRVLTSVSGFSNAASAVVPVLNIFPVLEGCAVPSSNSAHGSNGCTKTPHRFAFQTGGKSFDRTIEVITASSISATNLSLEEVDDVLQAYESGSILSGVDLATRQASAHFPYAQFTSALRAKRAERVKVQQSSAAIVARSLSIDSTNRIIAPPFGKLKRIRAKETIVSGFVPINFADRCSDSVVNLRQFQFANAAMMWTFRCSEARDESRTLWYMASGPGVLANPLSLPEPREGFIRAGVDGLANVAFDWDFGILRSYDYRAGHEDCGTFRAWAYTNQGWHLVERREMPLCKGLAPSDWIRTYYLQTDGAASDE